MRTRLTPDAIRSAALDAARALLVEDGPQAVTLKAVAGRVGKSHGTLIHHFGSAAGLQSALAASMTEEISEKIAATVLAAPPGEADRQAIVDLIFDSLSKQGGGALAAWMIASGDPTALDPVLAIIHDLAERLGSRDGTPVRERSLLLTLLALGDALVGEPIADALGLPRDAARAIAVKLIEPRGVADSGLLG